MGADGKRKTPVLRGASMKCLILAAGQGTRLRAIAASKPLAEVGGAALLEHVVASARAAGASGFVIVTGYEAERVEGMARRLGPGIETVGNPDWDRPNGVSVLAAADRLGGEFALLMSDHLFDSSILRDLIAAGRGDAELVLGADFDVANPRLDIDDATKIEVGRDGTIVRIGKTLERYQAIDTGIFLAGPSLFDAILESLAAGGTGSLSEGVQRLADAGLARVRDIGGRWWLDVDDEAAFAKAEAYLALNPAT